MSTRVPSPSTLGSVQSGPDYWAARRALWLTPCPQTEPGPSQAQDVSKEQSMNRKLVELLDEPGAEASDEYWEGGLQRIWKGLVGSAKVKHPLPLRTVIKLLHTGWLRDGTWPKGAIAPSTSSDEENVS